MSGGTDFPFLIPVAAVCAIALATDLVAGKIYNWLTLPALALGLVASFWLSGPAGLATAALGAGAGLALYGALFAVRVLGGGDVKLLMALGAFGGPKYAIEVALVSILLGGVMAFVWLAWKGKILGFLERFRRTAMSIAVKELEFEPFRADRSTRMPFALPIGAAALWCAVAQPLRALGVSPW